MQWQRDLSISHNKIGEVLSAQGDLPGALAQFKAYHAIAESLARRDPGNMQWQRDLMASHWRLANMGEDAAGNWRRCIEILEAMETAGRLAPPDRQWLEEARRKLAAASEKQPR